MNGVAFWRRITRRLQRRWFYARIFYVHRMDAARIERWQSKRLAELMHEVARHIPAYAELMRERGIDPRSITQVRDLVRLPILNKQFFIDRPIEEITNNARPHASLWTKTSGTSGRPLSVLRDRWTFDIRFSEFCSYRFLVWKGALPTQIQSDFKIVRFDVRPHQIENRLYMLLKDFRADPERTVREIAAFGPDVIAGYTSTLLDLCDVLEKKPELPRLHPRHAVSVGEMLSPSARARIQESLGTEIFDRYGMGEVGNTIAIECSEHDGMHVNSESVIVEAVDDAGVHVPDGVEGRILVTDLQNSNMPFIRYEAGDRGRIETVPCACGLATARLWIEGRYSAYLTFEGHRIHHLEFDAALDGFMNAIIQYQVVKRSERELIVRIVPGAVFSESVCAHVLKNLAALVGPTVSIAIERRDSLPRMPRGKSQIVADESDRAS